MRKLIALGHRQKKKSQDLKRVQKIRQKWFNDEVKTKKHENRQPQSIFENIKGFLEGAVQRKRR